MNRVDELEVLELHDGKILSAEYARELAQPFGIQPKVRPFQFGEGEVGETSVVIWGILALDLAEEIALSIGVEPMTARAISPGRPFGKNMPMICDWAIEKLNGQDQQGQDASE